MSHDLKASISLKNNFDETKKENELLSNEILELKDIISKFQKGKKTLDNILIS